ncbi:hypothetical protein [Altererythrobacter lutimaris]|uniref:DUF2147 domain-containing protein n=1 Tax=Altererythrobacter lutimaris TaxID=2743979 RepID=A0A850H2S8_9SPHN|nr:hypothetical protein [Altererythrobacter lutimaris]NVE93457.1 hypothetical protein [Altererythrobacter lutimaris]
MIKALLLYAAAVPLAAGPALPEATSSDEEVTITAKLCSGGGIEIDLGLPKEDQQDAPCELEACHGGTCRKKIDLRQ